MNDVQLRETSSLCSKCKHNIPATIWKVGSTVVMRKSCPDHGASEVMVSSSAAWYEDAMSFAPVLVKPEAKKEATQGCPFDCGPCTKHEQSLKLPIVPITSSCNLDCPICYTHNKNKAPYQMSDDELRSILKHLRVAMPDRRIINITGGEPTQHPSFDRLIELCREEGIHRVTLSTHGLRFLKEPELLAKLAKLDARVVLSFDSFKQEINQEMLGGKFLESKMKVLELLEKYGVNTTLLPVLARGRNDDEVGKFIELTLSKDFIRSVELHTMTFTGQNGSQFDRTARYSTYDVLIDIEKQTKGMLKASDFVPSPAAHPLCYAVTYVLKLDNGKWLPFPRFMSRQDLRELLAGGLYLEPGQGLEQTFQDIINRIWSGEIQCEEPEVVLSTLKGVVSRIFKAGLTPDERLAAAEGCSKAIYIHAHMDEDNFDTDRIRQCCVGIREPDGTNVPSCSYNVLYRARDHRFTPIPLAPISTLGPGRKFI